MREKRYVPCLRTAPGSLDKGRRTLVATISSDSIDRDGEIVEPGAFRERIATFQTNPVLLWMHNAQLPPIGKVLDLTFESDRIVASIRFNPEGRNELSDTVFECYADGTLSSFSIGFRVHRVDRRDGAPPRIVDAELYEVSAVTIPANPDATAKRLELLATGFDYLPESIRSDELAVKSFGHALGSQRMRERIDQLMATRHSKALCTEEALNRALAKWRADDARKRLSLRGY